MNTQMIVFKALSVAATIFVTAILCVSEANAQSVEECDLATRELFRPAGARAISDDFFENRLAIANACITYGSQVSDNALGRAYGLRAWSHSGLLNPQAAVEDFKKAIELNPDFMFTYNGIVKNLMRLNDWEETLRWLDVWVSKDPEFDDIYQRYGEVYMLMGQFDEAIKSYEKALELSPKNTWLPLHLGRAHRAAKLYDSAVSYLNPIASHCGVAPNYLNERARTYIEMKEYKLALSDLDASLGCPKQIEALAMRCLLKVKYLNTPTEGYADCAASRNSKNEIGWAHLLERGLVHEELGMFEIALDDFREAAKRAQFRPEVRSALARLDPLQR